MAEENPGSAAISKTAIWVAAARAIGAREPDPQARNPDDLAERLLGDPSELVLDHPIVDALSLDYDEAMQNIEVADTVRAMIERSRFIDDALRRAIAGGATQVLIPGAGLDSHAWRFRDLLATAAVYEVDRPETSRYKRARVEQALGRAPENLKYVACDFQRETASEALQRNGYDTSQRTFVIMEGLTMYLPEEVLCDTFRFLASHAPGTRIVFDIASLAMVEGIGNIDLASVPEPARPSLERLLDMIRGEPWLFGLSVGSERQFLARFGLELDEILTIGGEESVARYLTRADGTTVGAEAHARAEAMREAAQRYAMGRIGAAEREAAERGMLERRRQMAYRIAQALVP